VTRITVRALSWFLDFLHALGLETVPEHRRPSLPHHYATEVEGVVEMESEWTGRKRERMGMALRLKIVAPVSFGDPGPSDCCGPTLSPKDGEKGGAPEV